MSLSTKGLTVEIVFGGAGLFFALVCSEEEDGDVWLSRISKGVLKILISVDIG